jgi:hypothetical protein
MLRSLIAAIAARLRHAARLRRHREPVPSPAARTLAAERKGHFFSWFHLDPLGDPVPAASGRTWHRFRPDGEAFRAFVELDVLSPAASCNRAWGSIALSPTIPATAFSPATW